MVDFVTGLLIALREMFNKSPGAAIDWVVERIKPISGMFSGKRAGIRTLAML